MGNRILHNTWLILYPTIIGIKSMINNKVSIVQNAYILFEEKCQ